MLTSNSSKKEDSAYLRLVSWCAPGTQPTYSPKANALQGDSKDKMIVAQVAFKCASWFYAASGCPEDEAAARILDLAHDLMKGMYELARGA